jgi:hypothetical protein
MEFTKLTIIPEDGLVSIDGQGYTELSIVDVPEDIHALQWYGKGGEIEYIADDYGETKPNIRIDKLPKWTEKSVSVWETTNKKAIEAAALEAAEAAEAARLIAEGEFTPEERPLPEDFPRPNS